MSDHLRGPVTLHAKEGRTTVFSQVRKGQTFFSNEKMRDEKNIFIKMSEHWAQVIWDDYHVIAVPEKESVTEVTLIPDN